MNNYDILIVGSGPAAYSAALKASSTKIALLEGGIIKNIGPGGQLTTTTNVDNYPGFPDGIEGPELMRIMKQMAVERGVCIIPETVVTVNKCAGGFCVASEKNKYTCKTVIVASGASARRLYVKGTGDDEYWQKGISACAVCDGYAFMNQDVCVIGGGDSAMEETMFLSKICRKVYLVHRRNEFRARADKFSEIKKVPNVEILTPYVLDSANGGEFLEFILIKNSETGEIKRVDVEGLFFGIGHDPNVEFIKDLKVVVDNDGYIVVDESMATNIDGVFAAGDVCDKKYKQAVTAASSGCIAAINAMKYLEKQ